MTETRFPAISTFSRPGTICVHPRKYFKPGRPFARSRTSVSSVVQVDWIGLDDVGVTSSRASLLPGDASISRSLGALGASPRYRWRRPSACLRSQAEEPSASPEWIQNVRSVTRACRRTTERITARTPVPMGVVVEPVGVLTSSAKRFPGPRRLRVVKATERGQAITRGLFPARSAHAPSERSRPLWRACGPSPSRRSALRRA